MTARFRASFGRRVLETLFVVLAVALSVELVRRAIPMYLPRDWAAAHDLDAIEDWRAARLYFLHVSPYSDEGLAAMNLSAMGHPPTTPFWFLALANESKATVAQLSTFLVWFLLPLHTFLCAKTLKLPSPLAIALFSASALFATKFVKYHCDAIQYSEPIAVCYVVSWCLLRQGRDARAGLCLGAALSMKLFPGLLLVMLLFARRFRALATAVGTYLAIAALMTHTYGLHAWPEFFREQAGISEDWLGSVSNGSLSGLVLQLITPACIEDGHPNRKATLIIVSVALLVLTLAVWATGSALRRAREQDARAIDLPFALFVLLSAFLNAWVWDHYAVLTVQPLFILVATFRDTGQRSLRRWCEEECSSERLLAIGLACLIAVAGLLVTLQAMALDSHELLDMQGLWHAHQDAFYHRQLHRLQVANFAIWVVPILLCFLGLALSPKAEEPPLIATEAEPTEGSIFDANQSGSLRPFGFRN